MKPTIQCNMVNPGQCVTIDRHQRCNDADCPCPHHAADSPQQDHPQRIRDLPAVS